MTKYDFTDKHGNRLATGDMVLIDDVEQAIVFHTNAFSRMQGSVRVKVDQKTFMVNYSRITKIES